MMPANEEQTRAMNNTPNSNSSSADANQPGESPNPQGARQSGPCVFDRLSSAINDGASQAKAAAEKAIPKVKAALSGASYWLGYGVSFASVFSYTVAKDLAPESLKAGCKDGAQAGRKTASDLSAKLHAQSGATEASAPPDTDPSGPAVQSGAA